MFQVQGQYDPAFKPVRDQFQGFLDSGRELGASLFVHVDGETVLDVWGGYADVARTKPWNRDTLTVVWSSSKVATNLSALILVDRGQLDLDKPVATYWPEFGVNGKENVLVRHFLSHSSGINSFEDVDELEEIFDTPTATAKLALQRPHWTPGTATAYHAITQGFLVGELVRRVSGKSLKQFIADEVAGPVHADFRLGVQKEEDIARTAEVTPPPPFDKADFIPERMPLALETFTMPTMTAQASMTKAFRDTELGACNGFTNASGLGRIGSIITLGGTVTVDGKPRQIISSGTIDRMLEEQFHNVDMAMGMDVRFGLGIGLPLPATLPWIPEGKIAFWGGWGGSTIIMDLGRRATITYTPNALGKGVMGSDTTIAYTYSIYAALDRYFKEKDSSRL